MRFNTLNTAEMGQALRKSKLAKVGAGLAATAVLFAGCGQGEQPVANTVKASNTPAKTPKANSGSETQPQTTQTTAASTQENTPAITDVCNVPGLQETFAAYFDYSSGVQCQPVSGVKPGHVEELLQYQGNTQDYLYDGSMEVIVDPDHVLYDGWTTGPQASSIGAVKAPDVNGNPAIWGMNSTLVTTYGAQELVVQVVDSRQSYAQNENYAVEVAGLIETAAGQ